MGLTFKVTGIVSNKYVTHLSSRLALPKVLLCKVGVTKGGMSYRSVHSSIKQTFMKTG